MKPPAKFPFSPTASALASAAGDTLPRSHNWGPPPSRRCSSCNSLCSPFVSRYCELSASYPVGRHQTWQGNLNSKPRAQVGLSQINGIQQALPKLITHLNKKKAGEIPFIIGPSGEGSHHWNQVGRCDHGSAWYRQPQSWGWASSSIGDH